ncbi:response regulator transcription factor [[Kitasatospora] papulosa]|uniref:DNA-binding response regulator n=1 Tax=[Kitasatospora] papulosa TaxID=1464011 RepID=UPI0036A5AC43
MGEVDPVQRGDRVGALAEGPGDGVEADGCGLRERATWREPGQALSRPVTQARLAVRMPPGFSDEGLRAAVALRETRPRLPVLVLSQYVQRAYAEDLLDSCDGTGVGHLLKERVGKVEEFVDALRRVADGGTVVDPEVVRQLLRHRRDPLSRLTAREREVLALMAEGRSNASVAEGRSNASVAEALTGSEGTVSKHFGSSLTKLDLSLTDATNRRVLAVLAYLRK